MLRLNEQHLGDLRARIEALLLDARDHPDDDGVWTTAVWATVDREDRRPARSPRATAGRARPALTAKENT